MNVLLQEVSPEELAEQFRHGTPPCLPEGWGNVEMTLEAHRILAREFIGRMPAYPGYFRDRGIVICGGGQQLFTNAWVCIRTLRQRGCDLPVQLWYLGESELDNKMRQLVAPFGVECVDAEQMARLFPVRILGGWELKPYAILHCPFREVLLLDADNVPVVNPGFLFDTPEYREHGAIFWPDYGRLEPFRQIWEACEVTYQDEPEFESGQMVIDKERCWQALNLTMHYNEHSDFYYHHIHGDKETFHLAFRRLDKSFAMPPRGIHSLDATMCQHDFQGERIFQHRNMDKWRHDGDNRQIGDFLDEDMCRGFLADLQRDWCGRVHWNDSPALQEQLLIEVCGGKLYEYARIGYDSRPIELRLDRTIGQGAAEKERMWTITTVDGVLSLMILGDDSPTTRLVLRKGAWHGRWYRHERMSVRLQEITTSHLQLPI